MVNMLNMLKEDHVLDVGTLPKTDEHLDELPDIPACLDRRVRV